mgnify:CR=1 FL=1
MICYLDTSALVKLYVEEDGSVKVRQHVRDALMVATSKVAYAEARAAFARCMREGILPESAHRNVVANFNADWASYFVLELTDTVAIKAGELAERYALRGFDSIHLSSVLTLAEKLTQERCPEKLEAGCWDNRLAEALRLSGIPVFP